MSGYIDETLASCLYWQSRPTWERMEATEIAYNLVHGIVDPLPLNQPMVRVLPFPEGEDR
jgi:hypothetical protein